MGYRVWTAIAAAALVGVLIGYLVVGPDSEPTADAGPVIDFGPLAEPARLCDKGAEVSQEFYTHDGGAGYETAQAAIDDYLVQLRVDASLSVLDGNVDEALLEEMRDLTAPARNLELVSTDAGRGEYSVFDVPGEDGRLKGRVIVGESEAGGYQIEAIYMCATTLNSDPERFRELMVQAANLDVDTDPGPEPVPVILEPDERD